MDKFFSIVRGFGLQRGPQRWVGGVLGGIAARTNVDVAFVRIAFLVFCLLPGPAVVFYLLAWGPPRCSRSNTCRRSWSAGPSANLQATSEGSRRSLRREPLPCPAGDPAGGVPRVTGLCRTPHLPLHF